MSNFSIATKKKSYQPAKEGQVIKFPNHATYLFIKDIINENAQSVDGEFKLDVDDLDFIDKKLFLSHVMPASEYEWFCENRVRLDEGIKEYSRYMQKLIDQNIDEIYNEILESRYE